MLTQARLKSLLSYEPYTGAFTWLVPRGGAVIGETAGNRNKISGYIYIYVDYTNYTAHRLAFLYMDGKFPSDMVDPIDKVKSNNSWGNLRKCCRAENSSNSKLPSNNTLGIKGITFIKDAAPRYRARVISDGKVYMKCFAVKKYGDTALEEATLWVKATRLELHKEYTSHE